MNTKQFLEKLSKNWLPLVICFVIALFIYFFHQMASFDRKSFTVPVEIKNQGMLIQTGELGRKRYVKLKVRGLNEQISALSENDFNLSIDLTSQTEEGLYSAPVILELSERAALMEPIEIKISPERISVNLEKKVVGAVQIKPSISGNPSHGYEIKSSSVNPSVVTVSGPESMIKKLDSIYTNAISVEGASTNLNTSVGIVNTNSLLTLLDSKICEVNIEIQPEMETLKFTGIPVSYENLFADIEITSPLQTVDLELEGKVLDLEKITSEQITAFADCSFVNDEGEWELEVNLKIPSGLSLVSLSPEKIKITAVKHVYDEIPQGTATEDTKKNSVEAEEIESGVKESDSEQNLSERKENSFSYLTKTART